MKELLQKIAYLKGLSDGLKIDQENNEGRLIVETLDIVEELAFTIDDILYREEMMIDTVDEMDEDLFDLETYVYDLDTDIIKDLEDFNFDNIDEKYLDVFESFNSDLFEEEFDENEDILDTSLESDEDIIE